MNGSTGDGRGPEQVSQYVGQPYPPHRRPRPIFAPRDIKFIISLFVILMTIVFAGIASIILYNAYVTIECTVVVDVTVTQFFPGETPKLDIWIDFEGFFSRRAAESITPVMMNGNASSTFTLERIGPYTLYVGFYEGSWGRYVTEEFELGTDDDGATIHFQLTL